MQINLDDMNLMELENTDLLWQTLDGVVLSVLKALLKATKQDLAKYDMHPHDQKMNEELVEACKVLIKYYSINEASEY